MVHNCVSQHLCRVRRPRFETPAFVNLSICKIHHVLVQVVGGTHLLREVTLPGGLSARIAFVKSFRILRESKAD